jgi:hypothetical protein
MAEHLLQEARNRGVTVDEYLELTEGPVEIVEDPIELEKLQAGLAYRLYMLNEISILRLVRALPLRYRSEPYTRTGIEDDDFKPLCMGISRKD